LANQVHRDALKKVVDAYSELYDAVSEEKNGYEQGGKGMLYRSKEEVGTLLNA
jgi:transcription elongation factor Elf1